MDIWSVVYGLSCVLYYSNDVQGGKHVYSFRGRGVSAAEFLYCGSGRALANVRRIRVKKSRPSQFFTETDEFTTDNL